MKAHWHQGVALAALLGLAAAPAAAQTMGGSSMGGMGGPAGMGAPSMVGIQPGGEPGSGGADGGGHVATGNASGVAVTGVHGDLGINDPFAAAGSGVGGPAPGDRAAGSVNDALTALPSSSLDGDAPAGAPGPELNDNGPPDPLNPVNSPLDPTRGSSLMIPPGLGGTSSALPPPPGR